MNDDDTLADLRLMVPTYNATAYPDEVERGSMEEIGEPLVPVLIRDVGGIRIVLGTHNEQDPDKPDLLIERQPNGWLIFLHPDGAMSDPSGYIYILDGGRSFLMRDDVSSIRILKPGDERPYRMKLKSPSITASPLIVDASKGKVTEGMDEEQDS